MVMFGTNLNFLFSVADASVAQCESRTARASTVAGWETAATGDEVDDRDPSEYPRECGSIGAPV